MNLKPLMFLARRYLRSRRKHRGAGAPVLSFIGLAIGVLTLNAVLAVMNGFQLTQIESLTELSSSHLRWTPPDGQASAEAEKLLRAQPGVRAAVPTTEGQTLVSAFWGKPRGAVLRGFPTDTLDRDRGMARHLGLQPGAVGKPGMPGRGEVLLGSELSYSLGVSSGDTVRLTDLTGPSFSLLKPRTADFLVKGTFSTGYYEIDSHWILANLEDTEASFAGPGDFFYAVKLDDGNADQAAAIGLAKALGRPSSEFTTWRDYNIALFGALRTEKTTMMILVGLIFFVVGVNIYFGQKRAVGEHREDLAIWAAVGTPPGRLRWVFALEGLAVGLAAAVVGTVLGMGTAWGFGSLHILSSDAFYLPAVPAQVLPHEVVLVVLACVVSSTGAAWFASSGVTRIPVAEVLKSE